MTGATSAHFSAAELQCRCGCGVNGCTQALVDALEALREEAEAEFHYLDLPPCQRSAGPNKFPGMEVDSAYRCESHNASTKNAAKNSEHPMGLAADVKVTGLTPADLERCAQRVPAIKGIGRADIQGFLHVDVRAIPARWAYNAEGASIPYYPPTAQA